MLQTKTAISPSLRALKLGGIAMKNAHQRFGRLIYVRRTEKTATNIRLHLKEPRSDSAIQGDRKTGGISASGPSLIIPGRENGITSYRAWNVLQQSPLPLATGFVSTLLSCLLPLLCLESRPPRPLRGRNLAPGRCR
jgi:hypothetical protein